MGFISVLSALTEVYLSIIKTAGCLEHAKQHAKTSSHSLAALIKTEPAPMEVAETKTKLTELKVEAAVIKEPSVIQSEVVCLVCDSREITSHEGALKAIIDAQSAKQQVLA
jgi:hypothetical protein